MFLGVKKSCFLVPRASLINCYFQDFRVKLHPAMSQKGTASDQMARTRPAETGKNNVPTSTDYYLHDYQHYRVKATYSLPGHPLKTTNRVSIGYLYPTTVSILPYQYTSDTLSIPYAQNQYTLSTLYWEGISTRSVGNGSILPNKAVLCPQFDQTIYSCQKTLRKWASE
jgi:hypothetical protein